MKQLTILLFSVLLCACHQGGTSSVQDTDTIDVRLAVLPVSECEPFVVARDCGLYDSLGLRVVITTFQSAMDIDTAVLRKHVNVFFTDTVRFNALSLKDSTLGIAHEWPATYMLLTTDTLVRYANTLRDKTVAMTRFSAEHRLFDKLLEAGHFEEGDVFPIQINDLNLRREMLDQHLVSAALLPHPQSDTAIAHGARRVLFADSTERFALAFRPTRNLTPEKLELFLSAYRTAASATR